ncbi:RNA polymerase sigma-70 factor [Mangrovibacterium lignilyticum]|uniref:RNA polymerase sigma-70 factor n=1 Tax=Mangrovibacterium lignilyticum TaxID=2668052 RepID=UPI0013D64AA1|nr:RNA polymerase sigma-70 factor [Mangrovibacterium lignilyticum]
MGNLEDGLTIERLQAGDEKAFRVLFDQFFASLCLFAKKYVIDADASEDLVQDAFLKYWDKRSDFENLYKVKSYLYLVVRNSCLNYIRDNNKKLSGAENLEIESNDFFIESLMEEEAYRIFYNAVESLPQQMRTVIYCSLEGLKNAEIAEKMALSEHAIHAYKKKAYKKLKESLKDHYYLAELLILLLHS